MEEGLYQCKSCGSFVSDDKNFCPTCGVERESNKQLHDLSVNHVIPAIAYYFLLLIISLVYIFSELFDDSLSDELIITAIIVVITLVYALFDWKRLSDLLKLSNLRVHTVFLTVVICVSAASVVFFMADWINYALFEDSEYYLLRYQLYSDNPWLYAIMLVCVQPAIFEELAFRGFMFNSIAELSGNKAAVIITSFLFAILHLSVIGLFWLLPIGFLLAYFRVKYKTLWYGMIGHFCYNFTILYLESQIHLSG